MPDSIADQFRAWLLRPVTHRLNALGETMAASQADIDALAQQVTDLQTALTSADAAIQQEIANLQAQGVDVSGLQSAVAGLQSQVDATAALVPSSDNGGDTPPASA